MSTGNIRGLLLQGTEGTGKLMRTCPGGTKSVKVSKKPKPADQIIMGLRHTNALQKTAKGDSGKVCQ